MEKNQLERCDKLVNRSIGYRRVQRKCGEIARWKIPSIAGVTLFFCTRHYNYFASPKSFNLGNMISSALVSGAKYQRNGWLIEPKEKEGTE